MIAIPCSELVPAQVELDSALRAFIETKATDGFQLLYVGADWCAPCKALKPMIEAELINYPELVSFAVNLDENLNLCDSHLVTQLPTVLLCHKGRVIRSITGLVDKKTLDQLFALLKETQRSQQGALVEEDKVIQGIKDELLQQGVLASQNYYHNLPAQLRYNPRVQQAKSLIDLVELSEQYLSQIEQGPLDQVCHYFVNLEVAEGLELMVLHQLWLQVGVRDLYILAVNTLTDRKLATRYRQLLNKV